MLPVHRAHLWMFIWSFLYTCLDLSEYLCFFLYCFDLCLRNLSNSLDIHTAVLDGSTPFSPLCPAVLQTCLNQLWPLNSPMDSFCQAGEILTQDDQGLMGNCAY